ncbi:DUF4271 domain-containing protein [Cytophaga aurantiaca]|uniref:DUF4271 domain-containing protein n=1 Tax=Cytophaga aurantiaca TaxID=29530 RepID=UPI00037B42C6|nr:DUF4271 domain-containing protein [Cytophaga aurantiaca]
MKSNAETGKYIVVKDLSNDWQVYDKYYQSYIPLLDKKTSIQNGGVFLHNNIGSEYYVSFYSTRGLTLFVENKLIYKHATNKDPFRARIAVQSISKFQSQDQYLLLFYNATSRLYTDSLSLQMLLPSTYQETKDSWAQVSLLRSNIYYRNVFIFSILLFCVILVLYKFIFMKGRTLINIGLDRNTELLLLDRSGMMSITLIVINSLLYMIIYYILLRDDAVYFNFPFKFPFSSSIGSYIYYLFSTFALMQVLKIIYIKVINELTFPSGVSPLQNYLLLNYLFQAGLFILPVLLFSIALLPISYVHHMASYATLFFFIILVIISLLTSYMIYSRSELRNIYLFSYICTAEIVPLIIAYRFLLG